MFLVLFAILSIPALAFIRAWALSALWGWYMVPFGVPDIGWAHAYGIWLLVGLATYGAKYASNKEDGKEKTTAYYVGELVGHFIAVLIILGFGAIVNAVWM